MLSSFPPAGWYRDPSGLVGTLRWWDGVRWADALRPASSPPQIVHQGLGTAPPIPARAAWWGLLGFVVGELLGGALAAGAALATGSPISQVTGTPFVTLAGEVGLWGGLIGACVVVSRRFGSGSLRRDYHLGVRPVDLGIGVLVAVGALIVDAIVALAFVHTRFQGTNTQLLAGQRHSGLGFVVVTLIAAVGAPFFEELFFRGLLRTALRARIGPAGAIGAQAALFGLAHFQVGSGWRNVSVVVAIAGVGLLLGLAAERTGRLGAGMIGHGLFNLVVAVLTLAA